MAKEDGRKNVKAIPPWTTELFSEFLDHQEELMRVLHLSIGGIGMLRGRHKAIEVLADLHGKTADEKDNLDRAARERDLAQREIDNGFPLLHEQATVSLWGSLESLVRSFVARWLVNRPDAWQVDAVKRLRVRIGDYQLLEPSDRCLWVADLLDQEIGGPLRAGTSRFEHLLQPFGFDGPVEESCKKSIFELSQVRNVIVHRRATADRRLIEACPWLELSVGAKVLVTHAMWHAYSEAVSMYVLELIQRVREAHRLSRYDPDEASTPTTDV